MSGAADDLRAAQPVDPIMGTATMLPRIPHRHFGLALSFVLSIMMSGIISAVMTLIHADPDANFLVAWPQSWGLSWLIAFPSLQIALPLARRLVSALVAAPQVESSR